jgi:alanine dehydrogenase
VARDAALALGVSTVDGRLTHRGTAEAFPHFGYTPLEEVVGAEAGALS